MTSVYYAEHCTEEVPDRDGILEPCDRKVFGTRIDPEHLKAYPVCRMHYRPPYALCQWRHQDQGGGCIRHGGVEVLVMGLAEPWCDKAFEVTP